MIRLFSLFLLLILLGNHPAPVYGQMNNELFRLVADEYSALTVRTGLLQTAQKEILFSTFIIKSDEIGHAKLQHLIDAVKRGVRVKVILDDLGNKVPTDILLYALSQGVEIKIFNKRNWFKPTTVIRRMHGKMLITDSTYLLIGGRNVDNEYFRMDSVSNFLDREVLVKGERAVSDARQHFMAMWEHEKLCKPLTGTLSAEAAAQAQEMLKKSVGLVAQELPKLRAVRAADTVRTADANRPPLNHPNFIHANFTVLQGGEVKRSNRNDLRVTKELIDLVATADSTLDIEAAYFLPTRKWRKALRAAHERGVRIRVITNSEGSNDVSLLQAVYSNRRKRYERLGVELYEYCGQRMVHLKNMTIDREIAIIGSYNLERKSEKLNTEVATWVTDPVIAGRQTALFEKYLLKCKRPNGKCPPTATPTEIQQHRERKVKRLRWTLAPLAGWLF
jgi:putative cardiolipin synthase